MSALKLVLALAAGLALALWAQVLPEPAPVDAPSTTFSALRARRDVAWIAATAHPVGSPAHDVVRDRLVARLTELGLVPRLQHVDAVEVRRTHARVALDNVIATRKGQGASLPPLLVMSHYDSVVDSPGAADDGAGVATMLELARILREQPPDRDVVFAFTDGEEIGLLGAKQLFAHEGFTHTLAAMINLDARGGAGPTYLFELGARSDALLAAFAKEAPHSTTSSFAAFVYDRMPNGTDFTVGKQAGVPGLNFAFIADPRQYHTPLATVDALSMSTLQHMGDQALAAVHVLSTAELPAPGPPRAWADLFAQIVVVYPAWLGWLLVAASALLVGASYYHTPRAAGLVSGAVYIVTLLALSALLLFVCGLIGVGRPSQYSHFAKLLASCARYELAVALVVASAFLLAARLVARRTELPARVTWLGLLSLAVIVAAVLQAVAPRLAVVFAWPLLPASLALFASKRAPWLTPIMAALVAGLVLDWGHEVYLGLGLFRPPVMAFFALLASLGLYPLVAEVATSRHGGKLAGGLLVAGYAVALSVRVL
ncbi:MAG: M20/M25/M40 family metallo-hydrolase [Polyangia bacterium]